MLFWVGTGKDQGGRAGWGGGGSKQIEIHEILSKATSAKIPSHETTKKRYGIKKQHSKQTKTKENEINYKIFANPGRSVIQVDMNSSQ